MKQGYLSLMDFNEDEQNMFLKYLECGKGLEAIPYLQCEFGDSLLSFLDLFAGETIRIPSKQELMNISNYILIYKYLKDRNFTDEAFTRAASIFKRRVPSLRSIVEKVENNMKWGNENE